MLQVMLPAGVHSGQQLEVEIPAGYPSSGQRLKIVVPAGVSSGQQIRVPLPTLQPVAAQPMAQPMAQPVVQQVSGAVTVSLDTNNNNNGGSRMRVKSTKKGGKPQREYQFSIMVGGNVVGVMQWASFGELRDRMLQFQTATNKYPTRGFLGMTNYTTNEANVRQRATGVARFVQGVLNNPAQDGQIIGTSNLHSALHLVLEEQHGHSRDQCIAVLTGIARGRLAAANHARAAAAERERAIRAEQQADCQLAQTFNQIVRGGPALAPGQISTIAFDHPQRFKLRNRMWGFGDATITGPGGLPWFRMVRTNASFFDMGEIFKNCHFVITTMAGEPLLAMQEQFSWMNYVYDLYRFDPSRPGVQIPVCRVIRRWSWSITDQYVVQLSGPMAHHPPVGCQGRWPNQFTLGGAGGAYATVDKKMFAWNDTYHVQVAAGQDVLLFLGISCAIDRIHHEVEDARERRNND